MPQVQGFAAGHSAANFVPSRPNGDLFDVTIYTDGAYPNPGPSGYWAVLLFRLPDGKEHRLEVTGGYRRSTNNRMEMMGAIRGLRALKQPSRVTLYSDSKLLVEGIEEGWAARWRANGWKRDKKHTAMNPDLWGQLLEVIEGSPHEITFAWVKGHAGDPGNERADFLATQALGQRDLPPDAGYESGASGQRILGSPDFEEGRAERGPCRATRAPEDAEATR